MEPFSHDLVPTIEALLERHLGTAKEWFPHELVPWERGAEMATTWDPSRSAVPEAVRSALLVNLVTEDNLPYYFHTIAGLEPSEAWQVWAKRWTAEEGRHAIVIRDYLTVTEAVDPIALERARMVQVSTGVVPQPASVADGLAYVTMQELATRIAHRNTGKLLDDRAGFDVMARVAADENLHYLFYRDLASAALELDPSTMVLAIDRQVRQFAMPGVGIPDFTAHARRIAATGIYDFALHHDQILVPVVLTHWKLRELTGLTADAEIARDRVVAFIERLGRVSRRMSDRHEKSLVPAG